MDQLLNVLVIGLLLGGVYGLVSVGLNLIFGTVRIVNFAQGEFVMLPAFMMLAFGAMGFPMPMAFLATCCVAVVVLGWAFKRGIADPLLRRYAIVIVDEAHERSLQTDMMLAILKRAQAARADPDRPRAHCGRGTEASVSSRCRVHIRAIRESAE
jgi:branched-subunit amino acid ABC-type transport system permease component